MTTIAAYLTRYIAHHLAQQPAQRPPVRLNNEKIDPKLAAYEEELDELLEEALAGAIGKDEFKKQWETAALAILVLAFAVGSGGEVTAAGRKRLEELEKIARDSTAGLADDIYGGKYEGNEEGLRARGELWVKTAAQSYSEGQMYNPSEPNLAWRIGPTEKHCKDCSHLNGKVLTADEWRRAGVKPGDISLSCNGYNCLCFFEETDEPSMGLESI